MASLRPGWNSTRSSARNSHPTISGAGVRLPRRIRTLVDGVLLHETRIKDYDANPDLPADFFRPPVRDWPRD